MAKFCHQCGQLMNIGNASRRGTSGFDNSRASGSETVALTFSQFKARKEEDRKEYCRSKRPNKAKLAYQSDVNSDVKINITIMAIKDGVIAIRRMKRRITLSLAVPLNIG